MGFPKLLGRFSSSKPQVGWNGIPALDLAEEARELAGLKGKLEFRHFGSNATFYMNTPSSGEFALRVVDPARSLRSAEQEVQIARLLDATGVPVTRPVAMESNPIAVRGTCVSFWHWIPYATDAKCSPAILGALLRQIHDAGRAIIKRNPEQLATLPFFDPVKAVSDRIDLLEQRKESPEVIHALRSGLAVANEKARHIINAADSLIHADWTYWNVIAHRPRRVARTQFIITDLEEAGVGPRSWDLVPLLHECRRYGRPFEDWLALCAGYGATEKMMEEARTLRLIREYSNISWAIKVRHDGREQEREARKRIAVLLGHDTGQRWHHSHPVAPPPVSV